MEQSGKFFKYESLLSTVKFIQDNLAAAWEWMWKPRPMCLQVWGMNLHPPSQLYQGLPGRLLMPRFCLSSASSFIFFSPLCVWLSDSCSDLWAQNMCLVEVPEFYFVIFLSDKPELKKHQTSKQQWQWFKNKLNCHAVSGDTGCHLSPLQWI